MLPRRCKHCRCYIADWLKRCPRCRKLAPSLAVKPTKEEKDVARSKRDASVPVIHQKNMQWVPSELARSANRALLHETQRKMSDATTPRMRNTVRSELRLIKSVLAKKAEPAHRWTYEIFHGRYYSALVYISPKNRRYVLADKDAHADLIVKNRKRTGFAVTRLQLFEKSPLARMAKKEITDDRVHKKRVKAKKTRRAQKRKARHHPSEET
jgi:hypothetical protein